MYYLESILFKSILTAYFFTKATNCNPLGNCVQSECFPDVLFDYLVVYDSDRQHDNFYFILL